MFTSFCYKITILYHLYNNLSTFFKAQLIWQKLISVFYPCRNGIIRVTSSANVILAKKKFQKPFLPKAKLRTLRESRQLQGGCQTRDLSVSPLQSYILHQKDMIKEQEVTVYNIEKDRDNFVSERTPKANVCMYVCSIYLN